jgi:hypothetical protein
MKSTQGIPIYLKIVKPTRRWGNKKILNGLHQPGRHGVGGAPPPGAFLAQSQDNPEEWFILGLTCALVVRKHKGLS